MNSAQGASPRTPKEPMAFTTEEFIGGALRAVFLSYLLLAPAVVIVFSIGSAQLGEAVPLGSLVLIVLASWVLGAPATALSFPLAAWLAWGLNRAMRRISISVIHMIVNGLFGAIVGGLTAMAAVTVSGTGMQFYGTRLIIAGAAATAVSLPVCWRHTAAAALRVDRDLPGQCTLRFPI